jgi:tetratricopeptide (TPR) repeat protein
MSDTDDFQDFHEAVSEHTSRDEGAQQLKLARTCLDVGMTEDAIRALRTAAEVPRHRFEACALLGRVYRDRGELAEAIAWFERASNAPSPSIAEARVLFDDLNAARAAHTAQG